MAKTSKTQTPTKTTVPAKPNGIAKNGTAKNGIAKNGIAKNGK